MASRTQRYRLTHEFVLQDRADYEHIRYQFEQHLRQIADQTIGYAPDYFAIEKVKQEPSR